MSKQVNPNIGHIECSECREIAALRKNKNGSLYYDCLGCGRMAPNHAGGQGKIKDRAVIWGPDGAPAGVPRWIADQWPYAVAIRNLDGARAVNAPAKTKVAAKAEPAREAEELPEAPPPPPKAAPKETPAEPVPAAVKRAARGFDFLED